MNADIHGPIITGLKNSMRSVKYWLFWVISLCAFIPVALLAAFWLFFPPAGLSRLDIQSLPVSPFGFVQVDALSSQGRANGVE